MLVYILFNFILINVNCLRKKIRETSFLFCMSYPYFSYYSGLFKYVPMLIILVWKWQGPFYSYKKHFKTLLVLRLILSVSHSYTRVPYWITCTFESSIKLQSAIVNSFFLLCLYVLQMHLYVLMHIWQCSLNLSLKRQHLLIVIFINWQSY
jgi:hypothetical protein